MNSQRSRDWLFNVWALFWVAVIAGALVALAACK